MDAIGIPAALSVIMMNDNRRISDDNALWTIFFADVEHCNIFIFILSWLVWFYIPIYILFCSE